jgi:hypothetical protein
MLAGGNPDEQRKIGHLRPCHRRSDSPEAPVVIVKELLACCLSLAVDLADEGLDRKAHRHRVVMEHGILEH